MKRIQTLALAALLAGPPLTMMNAMAADNWPARPIRFIVPYPPGGTTDIVARGIGAKLSEKYGQQVVIDNRGGASTIIGAELMAKAAPDGYTMLLATATTLSINPNVVDKLPYDTLRDFAPVTQTVYVPFVIAAHPSVPANNISELLALARNKPGSISYSTPGTASTNHLGGALLEYVTGVKLLHVPFKGSGPAAAAVVGGQVSFVITGIATVLPFVKGGKIRVLAFASPQRHPNFPDIPSTGEAGIKNYESGTWFSVVGRAGTARPIIARLNKDIIAALNTPDLKERLTNIGFDVRTQSPEEFAKFIRDDLALSSKVIKAAGIRLE